MSDTPRKFNPWPAGIIAWFAIFISATLGLVIFAVTQRSDLVAQDYYEQEVRFQERIDQSTRAREFSGQIEVRHDAAQQQLILVLPREHAARGGTGRIELYRPSAAGLDRRIPLALDEEGRQSLDATTLAPGLWKVRVFWRVGNEDFFREERVVVPRKAGA